MVVGFNHNVMYNGEVFHIQTEDSGLANPHIITLLYRGGTILASKKTSYADIIKIENLEQVVEELMKEQHKEMLRNLKGGQFDERVNGSRPTTPSESVKSERKPADASTPSPPPPRQAPRQTGNSSQTLDEVILDYLVRGENR